MPAAGPSAAGRHLALTWGLVALACLALAPLAPTSSEGLAGCPVKSLTGWPCPTCGATRATLALTDLEPLLALSWNPAVTLAWIAFLAGGLWALRAAALDRPLPGLPRSLPPALRVGALLALAANWAYVLRAGI